MKATAYGVNMSRVGVRKAYANFYRRVGGHISPRGRFIKQTEEEKENEKRRNLRKGKHRRSNVNPAIRAVTELLRKTKANSIWGVR
jgi:hypothetical protein